MTYQFSPNLNGSVCSFDVLSFSEPYELNFSINGSSYHVLLGSHRFGNFICIPNWGIGSELAHFSDVFWNEERLAKYLDPIDARAIVHGIKYFKDILE